MLCVAAVTGLVAIDIPPVAIISILLLGHPLLQFGKAKASLFASNKQ
jgi:hypothetical protein